MDDKLRSQLVEARKGIAAQLMQLEGSSMDPYSKGGSPDCRSIYAKLQREIGEIDELLAADGNGGVSPEKVETAYEPMVKWHKDGSVGNPTGLTRWGKAWAFTSVALLFVFIMGLLQSVAVVLVSAFN